MLIKDMLSSYKELKTVEILGWVRNKRVSKNVSFLQVNDGTCFETLQVVFADLKNQEEIEKIFLGSAVKITGTIAVLENKKQAFEILATDIEILASSEEKYPLQPKRHSYEYLREIAHLRVRTNTFNAVFRIRSLAQFALHDFFNQNGFVNVHSPILTSNDAEGAGEMFNVTTMDMKYQAKLDEAGEVDYSKDFFNKKVSLTVSGQLLAEAYALAFNKVYTFGPTFRAENSNTTRHAAEFWMLEPEIAFAELEDVMKLSKEMLIHTVDYILKNAPSELEFLDNARPEINLRERLESLVAANFNEITYTKAVEILVKAVAEGHKFENEVSWGIDLATEHEKYLTDVVFQTPVFVTDYPTDIKAFYMRQNDDNKTVAAMDLLVPGIGELIGGSQREERMDILLEKMKHHDLSPEQYDWYLQLRRYGGVKHAGYGIGFERLVMYVTGMENIRDVIPFPRTVRNCDY